MKNQSENKNSGIQYDAFISYRHVKTDSMVAEALHKKLDHSEFLIVICSPEALASEWVQREVE